MKKILYINLDFKNYKNKTLAQLKSFYKNRYTTYLLTVEANNIILYEIKNGKVMTRVRKTNISFNRRNKIKYYSFISNEVLEIIEKFKINYAYIRRLGISVIFMKLKEISKKVKIIYELPTYPFDKTDNIKSNIIQKLEHFYLINFANKYINVFPVILQKDTKLLSNMVIINNGIDIENYNIENRIKNNVKEKKINLVGIAHLNNWHGYDRILNSMLDEKSIEISFTIYSNNTSELQKLKKFVLKNNMNDKVFFKTYDKNTNMIDEINNYDIAVGGIGYHRRKAVYDTSIKNKEYCAFGIPFITACNDLSFEDDFKYIYNIEPNDSNLNFTKLYNWYKEIEKDDYIHIMHKYAKDNLSFDFSIKNIINKLEEGEH